MSDPSQPTRSEEERPGADGAPRTDDTESSPTEIPTETPVVETQPVAEEAPVAAEQPVADAVPEAAADAVQDDVQDTAPVEAAPTASPTVEPAPVDAPASDAAPAEGPPADAAPAAEHAQPAEPAEGTEPAATEGEATPAAEGEATPAAEGEATPAAEGEDKPVAAGAPAPKPRKPKRKPPPKETRPVLTTQQRLAARQAARERFLSMGHREGENVEVALDLLESNHSLVYVARFLRRETGGMDLRALRAMRDQWLDVLAQEERRAELREILRSHGALDEKTEHRLARAMNVPAMDDVAAPHLPVVAGRATVARGLGLEPLADLIRQGGDGTVLSELAKAYVKEGGEPNSVDTALAGARDILAEEMGLDADLRARLRKLFRREAILATGLRAERKGDPGRHKSLVGLQIPIAKVQPLKFLAIRRAEKERVLVTTVEPPEELVLPLIHKNACKEDHPYAGFLHAAIEDGYRRILKPVFQAEVRAELKRRADFAAMETFERNLKHRLLGPVGGKRHTLGLRPDVTGGHRWCAVDPDGLPTGSGVLPHEGTAGHDACISELKDILKTYEIEAIAVGSGAGRAAALPLAKEAADAAESEVDVVVVSDGGTHTLETMGKLEVRDRPEVSGECRGALSLGRRFQDPLYELVAIDPKALALGPHLHDVHQGRLRLLLDETVQACVGHVGVDPNIASEALLGRVPGFTRTAAREFVMWRDAHGPLAHKAALAAVPGVGTDVAEQAVGFLRLPIADDPRDRTQLHPRQYTTVERMAAQVDADIPALFKDGNLRAKIRLQELESEEDPLPLLKYVLYQLTAGERDERPRYVRPIPPPPGLSLDILQPGLVLEGRVIRAMPFGLFVDVGLETDALIPTPHIGDHPGIEPATVAPIGSVIQARVLEVIPERKRLTLTMRPDRALFDRGGPRHRGGPRRDGPGGRGPRRDDRGGGGRGPQGGGRGPQQGGGARGGGARGGGAGGRPQRKPQRKQGKFGGGGVSEIFSGRGRRDERGVPRRISLGPDEGAGKKKPAEEKADEQNLTEEELLARKLADLKKKFGGGDA